MKMPSGQSEPFLSSDIVTNTRWWNHPRQRMTVAGLLFVIALVLRIVLFIGLDGFDGILYNFAAHQIASSTYEPIRYEFALRYLLTVPMAVSMKIFGIGEFSSALPSLLYASAMLVLTYAMARRLGGNAFALVSLLLSEETRTIFLLISSRRASL